MSAFVETGMKNDATKSSHTNSAPRRTMRRFESMMETWFTLTKARRLSQGVILSSAVGLIQIFRVRCLSSDEGAIENFLCGRGHGDCAHHRGVRIIVGPAAG